MNLKKRNKIYFLIAIAFVAFWFYNFRWIELKPLKYSWKNGGELIPVKATMNDKQCFKHILKIKYHDYLEKNNIIYIRAYLEREMPNISMNWISWGNDKLCDDLGENNAPLGQNGFFLDMFSSSFEWLGIFLDKLVMWNWDEPEKKK